MRELGFVSLLTNDSLGPFALALCYSFIVNGRSAHRLLFLLLPHMDSWALKLRAVGCNVAGITPLRVPRAEVQTTDRGTAMSDTFNKLRIWNLTRFERLVFIDADTLVLSNMDELLERQPPLIAPSFCMSCRPPQYCPPVSRKNSGLLVIEPSSASATRLLAMLSEDLRRGLAARKYDTDQPLIIDFLATTEREGQSAASARGVGTRAWWPAEGQLSRGYPGAFARAHAGVLEAGWTMWPRYCALTCGRVGARSVHFAHNDRPANWRAWLTSPRSDLRLFVRRPCEAPLWDQLRAAYRAAVRIFRAASHSAATAAAKPRQDQVVISSEGFTHHHE